jgi:hypothetical protein
MKRGEPRTCRVYKTEGRSPAQSGRPLIMPVSQTELMPNGHHGTDEEWKRLEAPLRDVDNAIDAFAKRHRIAIGRNYHNWPERSLRWGSDPERLIQPAFSFLGGESIGP